MLIGSNRLWLVIVVASTAVGLGLLGCGENATSPPAPSDDPGDITTVMGTGMRAYLGEEDPPLETALYYPIDILFDAEDRLLVLDWNNQRVRRLDHDGLVRTIMGTGFEGEVADGSPALETSLHHTFSMVYDTAGNLYLAGFHVPQIIKLTTEDRAYVIAGVDLPGYSGDGGSALTAELDSPCGIGVAPSGYPIYFTDTYNNCVRMIDASGTITTIAGNGQQGYAGDNGPAVDALFHEPYRIHYVEATGDLLIADSYNHVIRKIDAQGIITTVAGLGSAGSGGDGGPATEAGLDTPLDARLGPDGALYIADTRNNRIRRVDENGIITTVVGTGVEGNTGDWGPAVDAELDHPAAVFFGPEGNLWIADTYNSTIRRVNWPPS
jgi:hypothetical protein